MIRSASLVFEPRIVMPAIDEGVPRSSALIVILKLRELMRGEIFAIGVVGDEPLAQTWVPGGVCVICEGNFGGPSGEKRCAEPFR